MTDKNNLDTGARRNEPGAANLDNADTPPAKSRRKAETAEFPRKTLRGEIHRGKVYSLSTSRK